MKSMLIALAAGLAITAAGTASADEAAAKAGGCLTCHDVKTKKMGPAFHDVAAKYKGKADAESSLTAKLSSAKGHPSVKAKGDDLAKIVKWVLAQ